MKIIISFLLLSVFIIIINGCNNEHASATVQKDQTDSFDLNTAGKEIDLKNASFGKAFSSGDSAGVVNSYAADGKLFPPNAEAANGIAAIGKLVGQYMKFGIKDFHVETTARYGNRENVIEEGNYFMKDAKGNTIDRGKYLEVWRKINGAWKIYSDVFNSSLLPGLCK